MRQNLKTLRRRLREERCPEAVLQRVYHRVSAQRGCRIRRFLRLASCAVAALITIVLWSSALIHSPTQPSTPDPTAPTPEERRAVRLQAGLALTYIGRALHRAGDESRDIILDASLPPLRQGLRTAGEILSNPETRPTEAPNNSNS